MLEAQNARATVTVQVENGFLDAGRSNDAPHLVKFVIWYYGLLVFTSGFLSEAAIHRFSWRRSCLPLPIKVSIFSSSLR